MGQGPSWDVSAIATSAPRSGKPQFLPQHGRFSIAGVLGLDMGAYFPHVGRFSSLVKNVGHVEKGTVGVRQRRMLQTTEILMNTESLLCLPKVSALGMSLLLCFLMLGNAAYCICSAGVEFVRSLWA